MITIDHISHSYNGKDEVLKDVYLEMEVAKVHGIVGLNGAGKTTLLNIIFGLLRPENGKVMLGNKQLNRKDISMLPSESFFYSNITGREYLRIFVNKGFQTEKWNELFRLPLDQVVDQYSTGMKKKLAILGVIKQNKAIMILDEPFNGLDLEGSRQLITLLDHFRESGKTILITSHILETLTGICDFIHYLSEGGIVETCHREAFPDFEQRLFDHLEIRSREVIGRII